MATEHEPPRRVEHLHDLGTMDLVPVGTRVYVEEDGIAYIGVGSTTLIIAQHVGWTLSNVWIPDHVEMRIVVKHGVFPSIVAAAHAVLSDPISVHVHNRGQNFFYFFTEGERLRDEGLLTSRSTDFVDGVVELRHVSGGNVLRLFHLAPTDRNKGGRQLWP